MNLQAVPRDTNSQMTYELMENPHNYFGLDQTTGSLTIARQLDRLALAPPNNVLTLTVTAKAGRDPSYSSTAIITIISTSTSGRDETGECLCGQKKTFIESRRKRVVGGEFVQVNEFPWAALLSLTNSEDEDTARCGGSLISDRHVVT